MGKVDVLILGGGIQGLLLIDELRNKGYSTALVSTTDLGVGQTLHAQGYLHRGYCYRNGYSEWAESVGRTQRFWEEFLMKYDLRPYAGPIFLFPDKLTAQDWSSWWRSVGLQGTLCSVPTVFANGAYSKGIAFMTSESWINCQELVRVLAETHATCIFGGKPISFRLLNGKIVNVGVQLDSGTAVDVEPSYVIACAGFGNHELLEMIYESERSGKRQIMDPESKNAQRLRATQNLVVKGSNLPHLSSILPGRGALFIVSQPVTSVVGEREVAWILSSQVDEVVTPVGANPDGPPLDRVRLARTVATLQRAIPDILQIGLEWGVFSVWRTEFKSTQRHPLSPPSRDEHVFEEFRLANLMAVWPTKLTLAPLAASEIVRAIEGKKIPPTGGELDVPTTKPPLGPGQRRWKEERLVGWDDFQQTHELFSIKAAPGQ